MQLKANTGRSNSIVQIIIGPNILYAYTRYKAFWVYYCTDKLLLDSTHLLTDVNRLETGDTELSARLSLCNLRRCLYNRSLWKKI